MAVTPRKYLEAERGRKAANKRRNSRRAIPLRGTRRCSKCGRTKPRVEFKLNRSSRDGVANICLKCHRAQMSEWYRANKVKARTRAREAYYRNHERGKIRLRTKTRLPDVQPCEVCGEPGERHHPDYDKPDEVVWLCRRHHRQLHEGVKVA